MKSARRRLLLIFFGVGLTLIALGAIWFAFTSNRAVGSLTAQSVTVASLENIADYGIVPNFALIERSGKTMTLAGLRSKIWIADFFTRNAKSHIPSKPRTWQACRRILPMSRTCA